MTQHSLTILRNKFTQRSFAWLLILGIGVSFSVCEHTWNYSTLKSFQLESNEVEDQLAEGSIVRRLAIAGFGMLGIVLVLMPGKYQITLDGPLGILVVAFYVYALMSVLWADQPERSVRRLAVIVLMLAGIMAVVRHLSMRDLIMATALIGSSFIVIGIIAEIAHKTFTPWDLSYRFAGTAHPNTQGAYCAFCAIASYYAWRTSRTKISVAWLAVAVFATVFLVLTKSRSNAMGFLFGLGACWYITTDTPKRLLMTFGLPMAVAGGLLFASFVGVGLIDKIDEAASGVGRGESSITTLSGRLPLWENLVRRSTLRPCIGYGWDSFWTPERVVKVSAEEGWTVPSAHSVPIDVLLSLGLFGLFMFSAVIVLATWRCAKELVRDKKVIYGFPFTLIMFGFISGIFESGFAQPSSFDSFTAACSIAMVAFRRREEEEKEDDESELTSADHDDEPVQTQRKSTGVPWDVKEWKQDEYHSANKRKLTWTEDDDDDWGLKS
ncbi:MAG: exopolysaccharide production protein ExoQ [Pirellulaceae bacterium]|jgi:exopolysaccharide production protein ExoQ